MSDETGAVAATAEFKLLVIDDDIIQRTIISKIGAQAGFAVTAVATFSDAAKLLTGSKFDCVTLDLALGSQSGVLLLRTIVDRDRKSVV